MAYINAKLFIAFVIFLSTLSFCNRQKEMYRTLSGSMCTPYFISYQYEHSLDPEIGRIIIGLQHPVHSNCSDYLQSADSILEFAGHCIPQMQKTGLTGKVHGKCSAISFRDHQFTCDTLSQLFDSKGIENYKIQIGDRIITKGVDPRQKAWRGEIHKQKIPK